MRCLVTGGGGFLGTHLVQRLLRDGHDVRVLDIRPPNTADERKLDWVQGDFSHKEVAAQSVDGCEVIFHLASTTLPRTAHEDPEYDIRTNIAGSVGLIRAVKNSGARRFIYLSSGGTVYGVPRNVPIREDHPTNPINAYGIGKLTVERYLQMYGYLEGLDYVTLRLANPYGPGQRPETAQGVITAFLYNIARGKEIVVWGDGTVVRDYVYVDDAVEAIAQAGSTVVSRCALNIGSGAGYSVLQIIEIIKEVIGHEVAIAFQSGRPFDVPSNVLDIERARSDLGWRPVTEIRDGIRSTYQHIQRKDR